MIWIYRYAALALLLFSTFVTSAYSQTLSLDLMPDKAKVLAEIAVTVAEKANGQRLDYSPESLKAVDQLVLGFRKEGNTPQTMRRTLLALGCYVGEVMVRNLGYKWDNPSEKEMALGFDVTGIRGKDGGLSNPIGKVYKLIQNGEEDSVVFFYQVFSQDMGKAIDKQGQKN